MKTRTKPGANQSVHRRTGGSPQWNSNYGSAHRTAGLVGRSVRLVIGLVLTLAVLVAFVAAAAFLSNQQDLHTPNLDGSSEPAPTSSPPPTTP